MKNVRVDEDGDLRCPKCGAKAFRPKRSFRAKAVLIPAAGVGALAAPKRLKCLACGELLKAGNAKPIRTPSAGGAGAVTTSSATTTTSVPSFTGGGEIRILEARGLRSDEIATALAKVTDLSLKQRRSLAGKIVSGSPVQVSVKTSMRPSGAVQVLRNAGIAATT